MSKVLFAFSADVFPASQRTLISGALNAAGNIGAALGGLMSFGQSFSRMDNFLPRRDSENLKTAWFV